jgi:hypothetical protein
MHPVNLAYSEAGSWNIWSAVRLVAWVVHELYEHPVIGIAVGVILIAILIAIAVRVVVVVRSVRRDGGASKRDSD